MAMAEIEALQRYCRYLELIEAQALRPSDDEEYLELLAPGEAVDLLCARDELAGAPLTPGQQREVQRLDGLLRKHARLVSGNAVPPPNKPEHFWWWFLSPVGHRAGSTG